MDRQRLTETSMSQSIRHPQILEIARRDGKVTVDQLAEHLGVTLQTVRRDLTELADSGKLERVHGGAVLPSGTECPAKAGPWNRASHPGWPD